jgi:hypothetical protein
LNLSDLAADADAAVVTTNFVSTTAVAAADAEKIAAAAEKIAVAV